MVAQMGLKWFCSHRKESLFQSTFSIILFIRSGNKKQFLIADGRTIYGFSPKVRGQGFPTCTSFVDKTCNVKCKVGRLKRNNLKESLFFFLENGRI